MMVWVDDAQNGQQREPESLKLTHRLRFESHRVDLIMLVVLVVLSVVTAASADAPKSTNWEGMIVTLPRVPGDEKWTGRYNVLNLHALLENCVAVLKRIWSIHQLTVPTLQKRLLRIMLRKQLDRFPIEIGTRFVSSSLTLAPCTSQESELGLCLSQSVCARVGGIAVGGRKCFLGKTCCIIPRIVTACSATIVSNNTFWQWTSGGAGSVCVMSAHLNSGVVQQKNQPVCQIRLDFDMFSIAQPDADTVCSSDRFQVSGALNSVPVICGDNAKQHMYVSSKSTTTNIRLSFVMGREVGLERSWRIKISLLPCHGDYLAPPDCLQYFTATVGTVKSFNWKDAIPIALSPRQLAHQNYRICFRAELLLPYQTATTMCLNECSTSAGSAFSLSRDSLTDLTSGAGGTGVTPAINSCPEDYLLFAGGFSAVGEFNDRFCGNQFNPGAGRNSSISVCTNIRPFSIQYITNGQEIGEAGNNGFCFHFVQF